MTVQVVTLIITLVPIVSAPLTKTGRRVLAAIVGYRASSRVAVDSSGSHTPTLREIWEYLANLPPGEHSPLYALAVVIASVVVITQTWLTGLFVGEGHSWAVLLLVAGMCVAPSIDGLHRAKRFGSIHVWLVATSVLILVVYQFFGFSSTMEAHEAYEGFDRWVSLAAFGRPAGGSIITLALIRSIFKRGTGHRSRRVAAPGWFMMGAGSLSTYVLSTSAWDLGLAAGCAGAGWFASVSKPTSSVA